MTIGVVCAGCKVFGSARAPWEGIIPLGATDVFTFVAFDTAEESTVVGFRLFIVFAAAVVELFDPLDIADFLFSEDLDPFWETVDDWEVFCPLDATDSTFVLFSASGKPRKDFVPLEIAWVDFGPFFTCNVAE